MKRDAALAHYEKIKAEVDSWPAWVRGLLRESLESKNPTAREPVCTYCQNARQPVCPYCQNARQVWVNQLTGNLTCHRAGCQTEIKEGA